MLLKRGLISYIKSVDLGEVLMVGGEGFIKVRVIILIVLVRVVIN